MIHASRLLAKMESVKIDVYRTDGPAGPAWLWVLLFAIAGALFAVTMLLVVMLLRRARASRAAAPRVSARGATDGRQGESRG